MIPFTPPPAASAPGWRLPAALLLAAGLATGSHAWLGQGALLWRAPQAAPALVLQAAAPASAPGAPDIEAMVQRLADRLAAQPADVPGWRRLARAYETLERHEAAIEAYRQLLKQQPADADALCELALVLALQRGDLQLRGESQALVQQALKADPNHLQALALAGGIALERGQPQEARRLWQRVLDQVPPGTELHRDIEASIARTRQPQP